MARPTLLATTSVVWLWPRLSNGPTSSSSRMLPWNPFRSAVLSSGSRSPLVVSLSCRSGNSVVDNEMIGFLTVAVNLQIENAGHMVPQVPGLTCSVERMTIIFCTNFLCLFVVAGPAGRCFRRDQHHSQPAQIHQEVTKSSPTRIRSTCSLVILFVCLTQTTQSFLCFNANISTCVMQVILMATKALRSKSQRVTSRNKTLLWL
jgi:hypothetical protein